MGKLNFIFCAVAVVFCSALYADIEEKTESAVQPKSGKPLKSEIAFGKLQSPLEVYYFTDWKCDECHQTEDIVAKNWDFLTKNAQFYFIDFSIYPEPLNLTPFNLSFMINNKEKYLDLRKMLVEIAVDGKEASEITIAESSKALGANYKPFTYADVTLGVEYFRQLARKFSVKRTPTIVIVNDITKKGRILSGAKEIIRADFQKIIDNLKE